MRNTLTISLGNARDSAGNIGNSIMAGFNVLIGDTNADGSVNSADISQTKSQSGQGLTNSNFREDLNADGSINSADISLVKSKIRVRAAYVQTDRQSATRSSRIAQCGKGLPLKRASSAYESWLSARSAPSRHSWVH